MVQVGGSAADAGACCRMLHKKYVLSSAFRDKQKHSSGYLATPFALAAGPDLVLATGTAFLLIRIDVCIAVQVEVIIILIARL